MLTEIYEEPNLAAGKRMDVRRFGRVQIVVTGMNNGDVVTVSTSGARGGPVVAYAGVKEGDLTVVQTITANGAYVFDALAELIWSVVPSNSPARVDAIAKD